MITRKDFFVMPRRRMRRLFSILYSLFSICVAFGEAGAEVKYMLAKNGEGSEPAGYDRMKRVYIQGGYNFHFSRGGGRSTGAPVGALGFRFTDDFRVELAYENPVDRVGGLTLYGNAGFMNFLFDAVLPRDFLLFKKNPLTPFVGFGAGAVFYDADELPRKASAAYNFIGGVSVAVNRTLAISIQYKYMKLLDNDLELGGVLERFAPDSHNVGAALRVSF
jgi:opacity protein-like surface antigen